MVRIFEHVGDFDCISNDSELRGKLKDLLKEGAEELLDARNVEYQWVSDEHIMLEEDSEDIESDLKEYLDEIYFEFIDELEESRCEED